jgi:hypothetical protein
MDAGPSTRCEVECVAASNRSGQVFSTQSIVMRSWLLWAAAACLLFSAWSSPDMPPAFAEEKPGEKKSDLASYFENRLPIESPFAKVPPEKIAE